MRQQESNWSLAGDSALLGSALAALAPGGRLYLLREEGLDSEGTAGAQAKAAAAEAEAEEAANDDDDEKEEDGDEDTEVEEEVGDEEVAAARRARAIRLVSEVVAAQPGNSAAVGLQRRLEPAGREQR